MFRTSDMVLIGMMVAAAAFTYKIKHDAESVKTEIRKLEAAIRTEEDTITILKADWSLLTQPTRLQRLAETFQAELQLQPVEARQFVDLDDIPAKLPEFDDDPSKPLGTLADGKREKTDNTVTGSTAQ